MGPTMVFSLASLIKICCILSFLTCNNGATLPKFSSILLFGDSLLDTGNNNFISTLVKANHPPYGMSLPGRNATGRFSDGKLMGDMLAEALGIKELVPPFLDPSLDPKELHTGVCFASAGSGYDDMTADISGVFSVTKQYTEYFPGYTKQFIDTVGEKKAKDIIKNSFVFSTSGSNDMAVSYAGGVRKVTYPDVRQYHDFLLQKIQNFIKALYDGGIRNIAIAGLPYNLPFAEDYNKKLIKKLAESQTSLPGSRIAYADLATPLRELVTTPAAYGIMFPSGGCCGLGAQAFGESCNIFTPTCTNPGQYFIFDTVHPTQTSYKHITESFLKTLLPKFL